MNLKHIEPYEAFCTSEVETNYVRNILVVAANATICELMHNTQHGEDDRKPAERTRGVDREFRHRLAQASACGKKGDI